jgi:hypothetical protein
MSTCSSPTGTLAVLVRVRVSVPDLPPPTHPMSQVVVAVTAYASPANRAEDRR